MRLVLAALVSLLAGCTTDSTARHAVAVQAVEARIPVAPGLTLAGTLTRPALPPALRPPVALLIGGSGPQDRDGTRPELPGYRPFRDLADALGAAGIAVLRLDDRGTGASSGRFAGATTIDFAADVDAALRWLRARPDVDGAHPALVGHSEGAVVALLAASRDTSVSALVLLGAPSRTGRELARWQRAQFVAVDAAAFPPGARRALLARAEADAERLAREDDWMRVWFALDPRGIARATRAPALLLHGENDRQVPVEQAEELAAVLASRGAGGAPSARDVVLRRFPATDHLFLEDHDGDPRGYVRLADRRVRRDVAETIVQWLATHAVANDD
jgi:dipeptidyl aminopeptidase/acylaminoacyl peptidase